MGRLCVCVGGFGGTSIKSYKSLLSSASAGNEAVSWIKAGTFQTQFLGDSTHGKSAHITTLVPQMYRMALLNLEKATSCIRQQSRSYMSQQSAFICGCHI
jgi:hypothetical protein